MSHGDTQPISLIIPAHNEEAVIGACLQSIVDQVNCPPLRIIVVPNGCVDRTADVARSYRPAAVERGHELIVADITERGKPAALNAGDGLAADGIRIYLDGDGVLSPNVVSAVASALVPGSPVHLCAPRIQVAPIRSWISRRYARVWLNLRQHRAQFAGCGLLAVSAEGRRRWQQFPNIIADDYFITLHFAAAEKRVAGEASVLVRMPEGLGETVRVRGRRVRGNREVQGRFPELAGRETRLPGALKSYVLADPLRILDVMLYLGINALGRLQAWWNRRAGVQLWERAEGSRRTGRSPA